MTLQEIQKAIATLPPRDRDLLLESLDAQRGPRRRTPLTEDETAVLIAVRQRELAYESTSTSDLTEALQLVKNGALAARVTRLNAHGFGKYLESVRLSDGTAEYVTIANRMIRQPATAMMALLFDHNRALSTAKLGHLEKFAKERDIASDVSYYHDYLIKHEYFVKTGDTFSPGPRLRIEDDYIKWLAKQWPVQSTADMIEVTRFKNDILWLVWREEAVKHPNLSKATLPMLVEEASQGSTHPRARQLAAHAINSLVDDGSLKGRLSPDVTSEVYFLNEAVETGDAVVTHPHVALLLTALADNIVTTHANLHSTSIECLAAYAIEQGVSLGDTLAAVEYCKKSRYVTVEDIGSRPVRIWRAERLTAQASYIKRVSEQYVAPVTLLKTGGEMTREEIAQMTRR